MSNKKLTILGIVAVLMVIWATVQSRLSKRPGRETDAPVYLIQGLDPADIGSVVLGVGEGAVVLKRQGGGFIVTNEDNYPAETSKVNELLTKCMDIKTEQFITDNPANHEDLGVTVEKARSVVRFFKPGTPLLFSAGSGFQSDLDGGEISEALRHEFEQNKVPLTPQAAISAGQAASTWLIKDGWKSYTIKKEQDKLNVYGPSLLTGVIVGKTKEQGQGNYVRLASSDKVYTAQDVPWFGGRSLDYVDQKIVAVNRDDIESVTVRSPGGEYTLKVKQQDDKDKQIILENLPAGKKLKTSERDMVFNALTDIRFTDVREKSSLEKQLNFDRQYVCRLKDSTVYTIKIAKKDDKTYIVCQADFTDTTPVTVKKGGESEEQLKKKEAKLLARDQSQQFTARHQKWVYEIADWKAKQLTKELSELLEEEEKPQKQEKAEEPNETTVGKPPAPKPQDPNAVKPAEPSTKKTEDPNTVKSPEPDTAKKEP